jgi:predicted Zn-dependent peptidase
MTLISLFVLAAAAADPALETVGDVTSLYRNGLHILVKRDPGAEFVAGQLYVLGGVRNWDKKNAGVEKLAFATAVDGGTQRLNKEAFNARLAALGAGIGAETNEDFSEIRAKSLKSAWPETFGLLAETFVSPALPASELELQRARQLSALAHEQENPDGKLQLLAHQTLFKGHPYENRAAGTAETVAALRLADVQAQLAKLRDRARLLLVVVGDVDPAAVADSADKALAAVPRGSFVLKPLPAVQFSKAALISAEKKLPTNYITSLFVAPGWRSPDFASAMVALQVLNWREFEEVRTKRSLSYAPHAGLNPNRELPDGSLYVTATDPNATMKVMFAEAKRLQQEPVPDKELAGTKAVFLSGFLMRAESTDGQADILAHAQIFGGDFKLARGFPDKVRAVTAVDVQSFAKKSIGHLQTFVLGDPSKLDPALFGEL